MTQINELLSSLCPNGVEYKKLGEIGTFTRGSGIQKRDFVEDGKPCIHYGQIYTQYGMAVTKAISSISEKHFAKAKKAVPGDIVIAITSENIEDVCTPLVWEGNTPVAISGHSCAFHTQENPRYIAYCILGERFQQQKTKFAQGTKVIEMKPAELAKAEIPVPPLEVQREIVRIMDSFVKLEAELEAELEARRMQYTYYRRQLLSRESLETMTGGEVPVAELGDLVEVLDSKRKPVKRGDRVAGPYPYYGANGVLEHVNDYLFDGTFLLVGEDGSVLTADNKPVLNWAEGKIWVNNHAHTLAERPSVASLRYLYYALSICDATELVHGTPPKLNQKNLRSIEVLLPPLPIQRQVVDVLDRFDALTSSLTDGLPAEIEARRQQYEFYRDRLLDFPRREVDS